MFMPDGNSDDARIEEDALYRGIIEIIRKVNGFKDSFCTKHQLHMGHEKIARLTKSDHLDYCYKQTIKEFRQLFPEAFLENHTDYTILLLLGVELDASAEKTLYENGVSCLDDSPNGQYIGLFEVLKNVFQGKYQKFWGSSESTLNELGTDLINEIKSSVNKTDPFGMTASQYICVAFDITSPQISDQGLKDLIELGLRMGDEFEPGVSIKGLANKYSKVMNYLGSGGGISEIIHNTCLSEVADDIAATNNARPKRRVGL